MGMKRQKLTCTPARGGQRAEGLVSEGLGQRVSEGLGHRVSGGLGQRISGGLGQRISGELGQRGAGLSVRVLPAARVTPPPWGVRRAVP